MVDKKEYLAPEVILFLLPEEDIITNSNKEAPLNGTVNGKTDNWTGDWNP